MSKNIIIIIGEKTSLVKRFGEFSHIIFSMIIAQRIKELRLANKVSQKKLADAVGVDKRAVIFWEQEINEPKATYIRNIAVFFNCTADYLLGLSDV